MVNGLALNGEGRAQAEMGIALDDVDGNGLFDLFVTKFFNETNTLSLQVLPGQFVDSTVGSGLGIPACACWDLGRGLLTRTWTADRTRTT